MADWEHRREYYAERGRLDDQAFENMLGRRVLRGLGCTEKQVYALESSIFGATDGEQPLWVRASRLFLELLARTAQWGHLPKAWHLETLQTSKDKEVLDRIAEFDIAKCSVLPVFFVIPKNGSDSAGHVYSLWESETPMDMLEPPYRVIDKAAAPGFCVVVQDATLFVRQFGPYEHQLRGDE